MRYSLANQKMPGGDMNDSVDIPKINRLVLQNLIAGLSDGLILLENDGTIAWANRAALEMHRIAAISELGADTESYRRNFTLRYRNNHLLDEGQYPLERLLAGETFEDVTVEISPSDDETECWVHTLRGLILEDLKRETGCAGADHSRRDTAIRGGSAVRERL